MPRYLKYRVDINSSDIQEQTEGEIKLKELVEENPSLALCDLLGEKGVEMMSQLGEMMISGKQGDIAMMLVTIAGLITGVAGAAKLGAKFARKQAVMQARKAGSGGRSAYGRKVRNTLRDGANAFQNVQKTANTVDDFVAGAGIGHLTASFSTAPNAGVKNSTGVASDEVLRANANLSDSERLSKAEELLGRALTPEQKEALLKAHNYDQGENVAKGKALMDSGFTREEAQILMDQGVAGKFDQGILLGGEKLQETIKMRKGDVIRVLLGEKDIQISRSRTGKITIDGASFRNIELQPGREITIGRGNNNDIVLQNNTVSRYHLKVKVDTEGNVTITDLRSTNGTEINYLQKMDEQPKLKEPLDQGVAGKFDQGILLGGEKLEETIKMRKGDVIRVLLGEKDIQISRSFDGKITINNTELQPGREITIGRADDNNMVLRHNSVSRYHLKVKVDTEGNVTITDLRSTNGTEINYLQKMDEQPKIKAEGREVQLRASEIKTWNGLEAYLRSLPEGFVLKGNMKNYSPNDLLSIANRVKIGELDINYATNSGGFRKKLKELLDKEYGNETGIIGMNNSNNLAESARNYKTPAGTKISAGSHKGQNPDKLNEDRVVVIPGKEFVAVIDGMGGMGKGDKAANILAEEFIKNPNDLTAGVKKASDRIKKELQDGPGAVFVSARIVREKGKIFLDESHAGDCLLMVIRKNKVVHVSSQDSLVATLVENGTITPDQALYHPDRNIVTNAIDSKNPDKVNTSRIEVNAGDRVLAMSDGVADNLTPDEIAKLLQGKSSEECMKIISDVVSERMRRADSLKNANRKDAKKYPDGYRSKPKEDNLSFAIIDI